MPKKNKLNIFLLKEEISNGKDAINFDNPLVNPIELDIGDKTYSLYVRPQDQHPPSWLSDFFQPFSADDDFSNLLVSSVGAVLIVPVEFPRSEQENMTRYFVLTFGYGRSLIRHEAIEPKFGLKSVLNSVNDDAFRTIRFTDVSGTSKRSSEQLPRQSTIEEFAIDVDRNLLNAVTATVAGDGILEGTVSGSDSLSCTQEIDVTSIEGFLASLYQLYCSEKYKVDFDWIDNIAAVKDPTLNEQLWKAAIDEIVLYSSGDNLQQRLWMAVPEVIEWESIAGFRIMGEKKEQDEIPLHDDIVLQDVLSSFRNPLSTLQQLKGKKIVAVDAQNESERVWSAEKCLVGELDYQEKHYCVTDGNWYEVQQEYVEKINQECRDIPTSDVEFIPYLRSFDTEPLTVPEILAGGKTKNYTVKNEARYNYELTHHQTDSILERYMLMDRCLVSYGGGHSSIEFCDVLSNTGQRIHIKRFSGSAMMSHLFNQGLVSASLETDAGTSFTDKVNTKIQQNGKISDSNVDQFLLSHNSLREVVFGIVSENNMNRQELPFFSKVALASVKKQLKRMKINVALNWILRE